MMEASLGLKALLIELKSIKYLSLTNFVKFVKHLSSLETKTKFKQKIDKMWLLTPKDK